MPTLGFLKKKRTKDSSGPIDPSSPTTADAPTLGGDTTHTLTPASSNTLSSLSQTGSERVGGAETVHASQRPPSQPITYPQPPAPAPRNPAHDLLSSRSPEQPAPPSVDTYQTDGAGQRQPDHLKAGGTMTPAQAAAQASSHDSAHTNTTSATSSHASSHPSTAATSVGSSTPQQTMRQTKGKYALGDFAIQRTLGTGSFGRVHLVQSKHNGRFYAVKVLKKAQVVKMKQVEHTNDERRMLQKVKHAFLVTLWGTFQDSKNLYMVMDFVEGGELFSLLRKSQVSDSQYYSPLDAHTSCGCYLD